MKPFRTAFISLSLLTFAFCAKKEADTSDSLLPLLLLGGSRTASCSFPGGSYHSTMYPNGVAITNDTITVSCGTVSSFSVSPALPTGLTLNSSTGVISGTPTVNGASSSYILTLGHTNGTLTYQMFLGVAASANITCNTVGIAGGCTAGLPYSCNNASLCFSSYSGCRGTSSCNYYL